MVLLKEFSLILFLSRLANFAKTITNIGTTLGYTNVSNYHYWPECGSLFLRSYDANFSQCRTSKSRDRCGLANTRPDCVPFSSWAQTNNPASGTMNGALCHPLPDCLIDHTTCRSLDPSIEASQTKVKFPRSCLSMFARLNASMQCGLFVCPGSWFFNILFPLFETLLQNRRAGRRVCRHTRLASIVWHRRPMLIRRLWLQLQLQHQLQVTIPSILSVLVKQWDYVDDMVWQLSYIVWRLPISVYSAISLTRM